MFLLLIFFLTPFQYQPLGDVISCNDTTFNMVLVHDESTRRTWEEAQTYCQNNYSSNLISIHSEEANNAAIALMYECGSDTKCYIGGERTDADCNQTTRENRGSDYWQWHDGSTWDYQAFSDEGAGDCPYDEPNTCEETGTEIWNRGCGKWNDICKDCDTIQRKQFICHLPPETDSPTRSPSTSPPSFDLSFTPSPTLSATDPVTGPPTHFPTHIPSRAPILEATAAPSNHPTDKTHDERTIVIKEQDAFIWGGILLGFLVILCVVIVIFVRCKMTRNKQENRQDVNSHKELTSLVRVDHPQNGVGVGVVRPENSKKAGMPEPGTSRVDIRPPADKVGLAQEAIQLNAIVDVRRMSVSDSQELYRNGSVSTKTGGTFHTPSKPPPREQILRMH